MKLDICTGVYCQVTNFMPTHNLLMQMSIKKSATLAILVDCYSFPSIAFCYIEPEKALTQNLNDNL